MATSIRREVDDLPAKSVTVYALQALDFVVPGEWKNIVGFENMVRDITGETDPARVREIALRASDLYQDPNAGYQRALWLYQVVDRADSALGAAAMANKVGERIGFLSFLNRLTPKADTTQTIDLGVKVAAEALAFFQLNGIPRDRAGLSQFASAISTKYRGDSLMRMVGLLCIDGIIPLGPDFTQKMGHTLGNLKPSDLDRNPVYKGISEALPGDSEAGQLSFINESFESVQGWMSNLIESRNITTDRVVGSLQQYIEVADDKLDYLAAFLDMSTRYFAHTGTQSLARELIDRAKTEV